MGKLTNGMNINECVHLDPDISLLIVSLLWLADRNIRISLQCSFSGSLSVIQSALFILDRLTKC